MKRKIKCLIASALTITTVASATACSSQPTSKSEAAPGNTTQAVSTVTVNEPGTLPIVNEPITLTIGIEQSTTIEDFDTNRMTKYMEEKTGIQLDFVTYPAGNDMITKLELAIAAGGEDLPDIIMTGPDVFKQTIIMPWARSGMIIPLNEYYDNLYHWGKETFDTADLEFDDAKKYITSYDGNIYGMYAYNGTANNQYAGSRINVYKPWLDKLGLDIPKTTDEFYDMLVAFRDQDPNGNGIKDEIAFTGYNEGNSFQIARKFLMTPFVYTQDDYWIANNGTIDVAFTTDGWREGLKYVNKLYSEDLIDPAIFTQDQATLTVSLSQDTPVVGSFARISTSNMSADDPNRYLYDRLEYLTGPDGETRKTINPAMPGIKALITKTCEYPDAAFMLLDYMNSMEMSIITRYGYEGEQYVANDIEKERERLTAFWEKQPENLPKILYGDDPSYKIPVNQYNYDLSAWGTLQNNWWQQYGPNTMTQVMNDMFSSFGALEKETEVMSYVSEFKAAYRLNDAINYRRDDLIVAGLIYTEEEQAVISNKYTEIKNYVEETWASYVTGALDINDDSVWNNYITTLEKMGLSECIDATQTCFTRMNK